MVNKTIIFLLILVTVLIYVPADSRDNPKQIRLHRHHWKDAPSVQSESQSNNSGAHGWQGGEYTHEDISH